MSLSNYRWQHGSHFSDVVCEPLVTGKGWHGSQAESDRHNGTTNLD